MSELAVFNVDIDWGGLEGNVRQSREKERRVLHLDTIKTLIQPT